MTITAVVYNPRILFGAKQFSKRERERQKERERKRERQRET